MNNKPVKKPSTNNNVHHRYQELEQENRQLKKAAAYFASQEL